MIKFRVTVHAIAAGVLICLALTACGKDSAEGDALPTTSAPATNIVADIVAAEAVIVPVREAQMSFQTAGRVLQILVSEGDSVTEGQALARMDTRRLDLQVRQAEAQLKAAQAAAAKAKTGARNEEIAAAEAAVGMAQASVKAAEKAVEEAEALLAATKAQVTTAESGVEIARGNLAIAEAGASHAQAQLDKLVAGPTPGEILIAEQQVEQAKNTLWGIQRQRDVLHTYNEGEVTTAEAAVTIAQLQLDALEAGSRPEDLAIARFQLDEAQATVQKARYQVAQAESLAAQAKARIAISEGQVAESESHVESAEAKAQQAQAQLDALQVGSRLEDLAVADAEVARANATLVAARNALANAVLKAPFAATVGTLLVNEGEEVAPQMPVLTLGDLGQWRVRTEDLGEVDVSRVAVGQIVSVTVDALGGRQFVGKITEVAAIAGDRRGDKVYMVTALLDDASEANLRWGMSAFLEADTR